MDRQLQSKRNTGGAGKLCAGKIRSLHAEVDKCAEITHLLHITNSLNIFCVYRGQHAAAHGERRGEQAEEEKEMQGSDRQAEEQNEQEESFEEAGGSMQVKKDSGRNIRLYVSRY